MLKYKLGWIKDKKDERDTIYKLPAKDVALPPAVSLVPNCPPVYDQGQLGSCTANAIAAAIEFERIKQALADWTPSRLFIYYNERDMEGTTDQDSGAEIRDGIKSVNAQGDCPETEWPYDITQFAVKPPDSCYTDAVKYEVLQYQRINDGDIEAMKACLASGYPFVGGITVYSNFPMDTSSGKVPMPNPMATAEGGHAILFAGYDDKKKIFIFRNSWGTVWGNLGYGTLPYSYLSNPNLASDFWTIRLTE